MKLVLWVVVICAVGFFALRGCGSDSDESSESSAGGVGGMVGGIVSGAVPNASSGSDGELSEVAPVQWETRVIRFENRLVPALEELGRGSRGQGVVSFWVDNLSNSVVISGPGPAIDPLDVAIRALDRPGEEAFVDAVMTFVRGDRVRDFELSLAYGGPVPTASASFGPGGLGVVLPAGKIEVSLDWLSSSGVLEVLDRPQLRIASGEVASVSTGSEVAVPTTVIGEGIARTSVEFRRVGLTFKVQPHFLEGGRVRLKVDAENGVLGTAQRVGDIEIPTISSQSVSSVATLAHDEALVIGGLESVRRERSFGLFGKSEKVERGKLYLVLTLRSGIPKAAPVVEAEAWERFTDPAALPWGDDFPGSVLPGKPGSSWERQEAELIRDRILGHPAK